MSEILVVYYSLTGNTKFIAEAIAESINAEILELKPVKELDAESGMKYFWGGFQATIKKKPKLKDFEINPLDYEIIFLGTPVWAWTFSPPLRSFLSKYDLKDKNVVLWTCSAGTGERAMNQFKDALKNANILSHFSFQEPLQNEPQIAKEKAKIWAKKLIEEI
jgi:flavodoxin